MRKGLGPRSETLPPPASVLSALSVVKNPDPPRALWFPYAQMQGLEVQNEHRQARLEGNGKDGVGEGVGR